MIGRRDFVRWIAVSAVLTSIPASARSTEATIRVGLIGAGSDGIVVAKDAMRADPRVRLVAIADESPQAARRALDVFVHPLRKGGRHPQVEVGAAALFGADALDRLVKEARLDVLLVAVPAPQLSWHLERALAAGVDTYLKPTTNCDDLELAAVQVLAEQAERSGVALGADTPWRFESARFEQRPAGYLSSQTARADSVRDFLRRRGMRLSGGAPIDALLASQRARFQAA